MLQPWSEALLALQDADLKITGLQKKITELEPLKVNLVNALAATEAKVTAAKNAQNELAKSIKDLDMQIETIHAKQRDFKVKTSMIRNNDEYRAAMLQIELCDKSVHDLEDQQLVLMERMEGKKADIDNAQKLYAEATAKAKGEAQAIKARADEYQAQIETIKKSLEPLRAAVPADLLSQYDRLRQSKYIPATRPVVVPVDGGNCGCCHMQLTAQLLSNTHTGKVVRCPSCQAIVYEP